MGIFIDPAIVDDRIPTVSTKLLIADFRLPPSSDLLLIAANNRKFAGSHNSCYFRKFTELM